MYFSTDSHALSWRFHTLLKAHATYLRLHPERKASVVGHADERGSREFNMFVGQRRAEAVSRKLAGLGAPTERIEALSMGEEKPVMAGRTAAALSRNRRVEIVYDRE